MTEKTCIAFLAAIPLFLGCNAVSLASDFRANDRQHEDLDLITSKINYRHRHSEVFFGTSVKQVNFQITQHNNNASGSISQHSAFSYFIRANSRSRFFTNSNIGLQFTATASTYKLSDEETDSFGQTHNENLSGYYAYAAPVIFYLYGDRFKQHYFKAGIAPGISIVNYRGNVILETDGAMLEANIETPSGIAFQPSMNVLLESKWDHWSLLLSYSNYSLNGKTHAFKIEETAATLAYSWPF